MNEQGFSNWIRPWRVRTKAWFGRQIRRLRRGIKRLRAGANTDPKTISSLLIAAAERDRKWLAMEMHDGLGQYLLRIKNLGILGAKQANTSPATLRKFEEITMIAAKAIEEVRNISSGLRPEELDRFGLTQALLAMVETSSSSVNVRFIVDIDDLDHLLLPEQEINFFRIVQESVNNILKHSKASCAWIEIGYNSGAIEATIWDDGTGFDSSRLAKTEPFELGFGLSNMKERARILGGHLSVFSKVNEGTILRLVIPVEVPQRTTKT